MTVAQLETIVRESDLMDTLRTTIMQLKAKEAANGDYDVVWNLQR